MKQLHKTQRKILEILKNHVEEPLTLRDLKKMTEASSPSIVFHHLNQLEKKGLIKRDAINPSNYQVLSDSVEKQIAYLNLYGMAQCGPNGSILDGNPINRIPVSTALIGFPPEQAFLVKARGDSMSPRINEGDFIIARKLFGDINGQVIVCVNKGEVLIKKAKVEVDKLNQKIIILQSFNQKYDSFSVDLTEFKVEGVVTGLLTRSI